MQVRMHSFEVQKKIEWASKPEEQGRSIPLDFCLLIKLAFMQMHVFPLPLSLLPIMLVITDLKHFLLYHETRISAIMKGP